MKTYVILLITALMVAQTCFAVDYYVRPNGGSYGAENGTDWNNAFDGFSDIAWSSVAPGDTIWVAGGTYTQSLVTGKSGTALNRIYIRKALPDVPNSKDAAGWNDSFASGIHQISGAGIIFQSFNYITISGKTTNSGGSNGWWIDMSGKTSGTGINVPNGSSASYIVAEYMDLQGPGTGVTYSADGRGIDDTPYTESGPTPTDHRFSHMRIWNWESAAYAAFMNNFTFEYIDVFDIFAANWPQFHPNGIWIAGVNGGIVRYSKFYKGPAGFGTGEGVFFEQSGGCSNWSIYGNLFYDLSATGTKAIEITSGVPNLKIYNNTFYNVLAPLYPQAPVGGGSALKNNLFVKSGDGASWGETSNNIFRNTFASGVFVNEAAKDFRIVSTVAANFPRNAGAAISADGFVERDMLGKLRGADGAWDVGALEYSDGSSNPTIYVTSLDSSATEAGATTGDWSVSIDSLNPLNINFSISGNGVTSGDYTLSSPSGGASISGTHPNFSLSVPANVGSALVRLTPVNDNTEEGNETVTLTLTSGTGYSVLSPSNSDLIITDDDAPLPAADPVISPSAQNQWPTATVSLTSATSGATIYYTTNGNAPTTASAVYSAPFSLSTGEHTIKAMAAKSGFSNSNVVTKVYKVNEFDSSSAWQEMNVGNWTNTFTWVFRATPQNANMDGIVTLSTAGNIDAYTDNAVIVRFNPSGNIDVRNGSVFAALVAYPYSAGTSYDFTVIVNVASKTYTVDVKPVGGSSTRLATNYAFRTEQNTINDIDYLGLKADSGAFELKSVFFAPGGTPPSAPAAPSGLRIVP